MRFCRHLVSEVENLLAQLACSEEVVLLKVQVAEEQLGHRTLLELEEVEEEVE
jgi:hypothetical protein